MRNPFGLLKLVLFTGAIFFALVSFSAVAWAQPQTMTGSCAFEGHFASKGGQGGGDVNCTATIFIDTVDVHPRVFQATAGTLDVACEETEIYSGGMSLEAATGGVRFLGTTSNSPSVFVSDPQFPLHLGQDIPSSLNVNLDGDHLRIPGICTFQLGTVSPVGQSRLE